MLDEMRDVRAECSRAYLEEVRDLAVRHRANDAYIRSLEGDAAGIGGVDYSREMVGGTAGHDGIPNSVALLIDMKRDAEADAAAYFERKAEARRLLDRTLCVDCFYATYEGWCRCHGKWTLLTYPACAHFARNLCGPAPPLLVKKVKG